MVPLNCVQTLEKGDRDTYSITKVIQVVIDDLRQSSTKIPTIILKRVAKEVIDKYPASFKDMDDDGVCLGDGSHTVYNQLRERNYYLTKRIKRIEENVQHEPGVSLDNADLDDDVVNKTKLNEYISKETNDEFFTLMESNYPVIRKFLSSNSLLIVDTIIAEWPIIFHAEGIPWSFQKLTNINLSSFSEAVRDKAEKVITSNKKTLQKCDITTHMPIEMRAIEFITVHFKENFGLLFRTNTVSLIDQSFGTL